jgi:hypothetical protein
MEMDIPWTFCFLNERFQECHWDMYVIFGKKKLLRIEVGSNKT